MAQQQFLFAEAISGMKKALARDDEASDSDESIKHPTNRGNKLKRKARFVQEGRLDQADGPRVYKRKLNYNGYQREIISKNPLRVDADGDVFDDEEDESNPDLTDAEEDPYQDIKLEDLLMPLTNAADLDKHPSLSIPYKSRVVEEIMQSAQDMVFREQRRLYRMRQVLTQFRGDERWIPCGTLQQESDTFAMPFPPQERTASIAPSSSTDPMQMVATWENVPSVGVHKGLGDAAGNSKETNTTTNGNGNVEVIQVDQVEAEVDRSDGDSKPAGTDQAGSTEGDNAEREAETNGDHAMPDDPVTNGKDSGTGDDPTTNGNTQEQGDSKEEENVDRGRVDDKEDGDDDDDAQQTHRMTTRARAQATDKPVTPPGSRPLTPQTDSGAPLVHPFFMVPSSCLPQPSLGLHGNLADDTRRLLASFVQKQEEVVRQAESLLDGLMKTRRLRNTVWGWCRAEGHVGEMSDGEDWYDMEEWGLDEPLKKGEEVDDEADVPQTVAGSKTRGRNRRHERM